MLLEFIAFTKLQPEFIAGKVPWREFWRTEKDMKVGMQEKKLVQIRITDWDDTAAF